MSTKVQIIGKPCDSPTVNMEVQMPECEPAIRWVKLQLSSEITLLLRNMNVLDLNLLFNKMIGGNV